MSKRGLIAAVTVAVVLVFGGVFVASNMGFKLNYTLTQSGAGGSLTGVKSIALPDNRQSGMVDAKHLMDDIGFASTTSLSKYIVSTDLLQPYTGRKNGGLAFPLAAGEGYLVKMLTTVNYIVVGSDDPAVAYQMKAAGTGGSLTGVNLYAYNYHQTAADAKALMDDIGFANTTSISRYVTSTDLLQPYTGRKNGGTAFALVPGEAYYVKMLATVNYTPSHY